MLNSISDQSIEELRQIAETEYGRFVSTAEATEIADTLLQLYDLLARSMAKPS